MGSGSAAQPRTIRASAGSMSGISCTIFAPISCFRVSRDCSGSVSTCSSEPHSSRRKSRFVGEVSSFCIVDVSCRIGFESPRLHTFTVSRSRVRTNDSEIRVGAVASRVLNAPGGKRTIPVSASKTPIPEQRGTESGTLGARNAPVDPDLALIQDRWPALPEHIRQAVLALVRSTSAKEQVP